MEEDNIAFNDLMHDMHQQLLLYKEKTSRKFKKLEDLIEVAEHKLSLLMSIQAEQRKEGVVNPFNQKANVRQDNNMPQTRVTSESVQYLDLRLPKVEEGAGVLQLIQDWEAVKLIYDKEPIYDEEPGEGQECWIEKEFILAALKGGGGNPKLVDYKGEEQQGTVEEEHSIILTNMKEELTEDVLSTDGQTDANSSYLDKSSSHLENENMIIFDPGGLVQEDHSKGVNHNSKDMIRSEIQLEETVMKDSISNKLRHWQDFDFLAIKQLLNETSHLQSEVFIIGMGNSTRFQNIQKENDGLDHIVSQINEEYLVFMKAGMMRIHCWYSVVRQGSPGEAMRLEVKEAGRRKYTITIFDPGGKRDYIQVWRAV